MPESDFDILSYLNDKDLIDTPPIKLCAYAKDIGYSDVLIRQIYEYASRLHSGGLPVIFDVIHLAKVLGYPKYFIDRVLDNQSRHYRKYSIEKRSGGRREIKEPLRSLKDVQKFILSEILENIPASKFAKAYSKGSSLKKNARFHRGQRIVLRLDVENFFGSITPKMVYKVFRGMGYTASVSWALSRLCCESGSLPQGAPTSPYLSNLVMRRFDNRIAGYCLPRRIRFTRYSDDMCFSGDFKPSLIISFVRMVLVDEGFQLSEKKTRAMYAHQQQIVTGVVVNKYLQAPRKLRREIRQVAYHIERWGLSNHISNIKEGRRNYIDHLIGKCNYILSLNSEDRDALKLLELLRSSATYYLDI